jgi:predicted RNA-binding protein with PIN domain
MVTAAAAMIAASVQVTASSTAQQTQVIQSGDATTNAILTELVSEVRSLNNNIAASVGDAVQQGLAG